MKEFEQIAALDRDYVLQTYERYPVLFVRGEGAYLWDSTGQRYLDLLSGIGVNALGYAHPAIVDAVTKQVGTGVVHLSNLFHNEHQAALAKKLCEISGLDRAFIANTGTEAWEGALKFARLHANAVASSGGAKKTRVLAMQNSFHGRSMGSLSTTGQAKYREPFAPLVPEIEFIEFNDVAALEGSFDESVAAVCMETVQGEGGVVPVTADFLRTARRLTQGTGALLVLDEIQCGLGRTGKWFAYQHYGVTPDIVTVAKPIAGGLPLAAVLMTEAVAKTVKAGLHGTTFGGGPLACAAGLAALNAMDSEKLLEHAAELGAYIRERMIKLQSGCDAVISVRVMGLMIGVELDSGDLAKAVVQKMLARKIIINRTHETVIRMLPPYIITRAQADEMLSNFEEVLQQEQAAQAVGAQSMAGGTKIG